jgi:hypothetical protein
MNKRALIIIEAIVLGAALAPALAIASQIVSDKRRMTGSACAQVSTAGFLRITHDDGAIFNDVVNGNFPLTVDCPVISNVTPPSGDISAAPELWYLDHSTSAISCVLRSDSNDSIISVENSATSTGDDGNYRKMTFTLTPLSGGYQHFRCTIPTRDAAGNASYIIGYRSW